MAAVQVKAKAKEIPVIRDSLMDHACGGPSKRKVSQVVAQPQTLPPHEVHLRRALNSGLMGQ
jgi:hypothetical protein